MKLSKDTVDILVDMIETKLSMIQVSDRDDLREVVTLKHCLSELKTDECPAEKSTRHKPTRGRRKSFTAMLEAADLPEDIRCTA